MDEGERGWALRWDTTIEKQGNIRVFHAAVGFGSAFYDGLWTTASDCLPSFNLAAADGCSRPSAATCHGEATDCSRLLFTFKFLCCKSQVRFRSDRPKLVNQITP